jgi:hypothetical protein
MAHPTDPDTSAPRRRWGPLVFAALLALAMLGYAWSVMGIARGLTDWLLILPVALIGAVAALWAGVADMKPLTGLAKTVERTWGEDTKPILLLVLTGAYACAAPFAGFDVGTAVFILLALLLQGERSWWKLALASLAGAALMTWIFTDLLSVRLPTLLF